MFSRIGVGSSIIAVLAVNQYYRHARSPVLSSFAEWRSEAGRARLQPMIADLIPWATMRDADTFVSWLDAQPSVDVRREVGSCGYCMGGPMTMRTAAALPDRIGAAGSFHGGGLVTKDPSSPHLLIAKTNARYVCAVAQNDDKTDPEAKNVLRATFDAAKRPATVEVYPANHGWCVPGGGSYDAASAEKAWGELLTLYKTSLA